MKTRPEDCCSYNKTSLKYNCVSFLKRGAGCIKTEYNYFLKTHFRNYKQLITDGMQERFPVFYKHIILDVIFHFEYIKLCNNTNTKSDLKQLARIDLGK